MRQFIILAFLLCLSSISFADDGRQAVIAKQLDCVSANKENESLGWSDLCYMGTRENHAILVASALDAFENGTMPMPQPSVEVMPDAMPQAVPETVSASVPEDQAKNLFNVETTFDITQRWDNLRWNISAPGSANILSELTWKDVAILELEDSGQLTLDNKFILFDWRGGIGWVHHGKNQDSDYLGDGRTLEFSRSDNSAKQGHVIDLSGGGGYRVDLTPVLTKTQKSSLNIMKLYVDALAGYSYNETQYFMTNGNQTVGAPLGPFDGLKSNYQAEWKGPWIGAALKGEVERWHGMLRWEYHWLDYYGKANWNLRSDFMHPKSYEHIANGGGYVFMGGGGYSFTPNWSIDFTARWNYFKAAKDGVYRVFFSNGTTAEATLNESIWSSLALSIGNTFKF